MQAHNELYASDAVSIEPEGSMWQSEKGIEALNAKISQWVEMVEEVHNTGVSDPQIAGNFFSCKMEFDLTIKGVGRTTGEQISVYEVKDGKIVREHFFYSV